MKQNSTVRSGSAALHRPSLGNPSEAGLALGSTGVPPVPPGVPPGAGAWALQSMGKPRSKSFVTAFEVMKKEDEPQIPQRPQSFPGDGRAFSILMDSRPLAFVHSRFHPNRGSDRTLPPAKVPRSRASFLRSLRPLWFIHSQRVMLLNRPWTRTHANGCSAKAPRRPFFIWMDS